ncbi:hypothetical protein JOB18_048758 [Solea senegalensis]|uniref:Uncharacterized protein n=1 Tax=Solea senegalensis TaxID=28829 RepID=A0AAV6PDB3_SOLSE|nr:hypothetical protein JOB18_048758 [Solea senegalensis]
MEKLSLPFYAQQEQNQNISASPQSKYSRHRIVSTSTFIQTPTSHIQHTAMLPGVRVVSLLHDRSPRNLLVFDPCVSVQIFNVLF